jgi:hypothetical protein
MVMGLSGWLASGSKYSPAGLFWGRFRRQLFSQVSYIPLLSIVLF